ncbi:MAG TPA: NUDIX hydrolase [Candidatus Dormibacteraeota bacterium]|nr:NUDIX hydrolase [Candidatus Dormibacteraeota bacterium]
MTAGRAPLTVPLGPGGRRIAGAQAVVVDRGGRVLLQFRPWPLGWEPPGGHVAPGETADATVVRETAEETGCGIALERLTGIYTFTGWRRSTDAVYRARLTSGAPRRTREAWRIGWFDPARLPQTLFPWYRDRIQDAIAPGPGVAQRRQPVTSGDILRHGLALGLALGPGRRRGA